MNPFKRKSVLSRALSCFALTVCALVVVVVVKCCLPARVPSDQKLIAAFRAYRGAFEQLHEMAVKDTENGRYLNWDRESLWNRESRNPPELGPSRWEDYKNLISQIRPPLESVTMRRDGIMRFIFAGDGSAIGPDWCKGIDYIPPNGRDGVPLPDLKGAPGLPADVYIREIDPGWFVFYQRNE